MYSQLYSRLLYPFYEGVVRGRKTFSLLREYEANQWRSLDELRQLQWAKLRKIIAHAYGNVPYYRDQFDHAGVCPSDLKSPEDLLRFPYLSKKDIHENQETLLASNCRQAQLFPSWTGGSTGAPIKFKYDRYSYECRVAASARADRWSGWEFGVKELYIWGQRPTSDTFITRCKKNAHLRLLRRKIINPYLFSSETLPGFVAEMNAYKPEVIVAYAGALATMAQFIKARGLACHSPRSIIATAEQVFPEQRELIENVFQAPVFNRYGAREFMVIGMECERHVGLHLNIDNQVIEVLKDGKPVAPGELGELVITDLNNYAMPFIRYKIGDLGVLSEKACPCGRGLPLLQSVNGRVMDAIKTRDGRCVTGLFFTHLMREFEGVRQFRVIQKAYELIQVEIVKGDSFKDECLERLRLEINKTMGSQVQVEFSFVADIKPLPSGKQRITFSELPANFGNH